MQGGCIARRGRGRVKAVKTHHNSLELRIRDFSQLNGVCFGDDELGEGWR